MLLTFLHMIRPMLEWNEARGAIFMYLNNKEKS